MYIRNANSCAQTDEGDVKCCGIHATATKTELIVALIKAERKVQKTLHQKRVCGSRHTQKNPKKQKKNPRVFLRMILRSFIFLVHSPVLLKASPENKSAAKTEEINHRRPCWLCCLIQKNIAE